MKALSHLILFNFIAIHCSNPVYKVTFDEEGIVLLGRLMIKKKKNVAVKIDQKAGGEIVKEVCKEGPKILEHQKWPINPYSFIVDGSKITYCQNNQHSANLNYKFLFHYQLNNK